MVQRLQHRAARIVLGNFDFINVRGHDLGQQLGWQTIDQRRDYYIATLMHKCIHETAPIHLQNEMTMTNEHFVILPGEGDTNTACRFISALP